MFFKHFRKLSISCQMFIALFIWSSSKKPFVSQITHSVVAKSDACF